MKTGKWCLPFARFIFAFLETGRPIEDPCRLFSTHRPSISKTIGSINFTQAEYCFPEGCKPSPATNDGSSSPLREIRRDIDELGSQRQC